MACKTFAILHNLMCLTTYFVYNFRGGGDNEDQRSLNATEHGPRPHPPTAVSPALVGETSRSRFHSLLHCTHSGPSSGSVSMLCPSPQGLHTYCPPTGTPFQVPLYPKLPNPLFIPQVSASMTRIHCHLKNMYFS